MNRRTAFGISALTAALLGGLVGGCTSPVDRNAQVRNDLSPELDTLYQRPDDIHNALALTFDENWRMFNQDWGRFWLTDRPSRLTFEPIPH